MMNQIPDEHYAELVADFARTLDLDAGLADATQPGHYSAMAHDLAHVLDLDTGLEAILTPAKQGTSTPGVKTPVPARISAADLALLLSSLDPQTRLRLRADPHYVDLLRAVQLAGDRIRVLTRANNLARAVTDALTRALPLARASSLARELISTLTSAEALTSVLTRDVTLTRACDRIRELISTLTSDRVDALTSALTHIHDLARDVVERDLERVRNYVSAFVQNLDLNLDLANLSSLKSEDIGDLLMVLKKAAVDFTSADLRAVSLVGVRLEGIRWSSATLWPPEWEEQIRAESIETDDGIFIIRGKYQQGAYITA
jgi:hypothetical protein